MKVNGGVILETIKNPALEVFKKWSKKVKNVVGEGNYAMERSESVAPEKKKYARIFLLGNPTINGDLEGDECATTASFQVDSFAAGFKSLSAVYDIDNASHEAMISMGFRRTYGPEEQNNIDNSIKRIVSRYSRVYMGELEM